MRCFESSAATLEFGSALDMHAYLLLTPPPPSTPRRWQAQVYTHALRGESTLLVVGLCTYFTIQLKTPPPPRPINVSQLEPSTSTSVKTCIIYVLYRLILSALPKYVIACRSELTREAHLTSHMSRTVWAVRASLIPAPPSRGIESVGDGGVDHRGEGYPNPIKFLIPMATSNEEACSY